MKEMNSLENQLRSWRPRRPSAGLKRRLFGNPLPKVRWVLGSLAPVTACALVTLSVFNSGNSAVNAPQEPMLSMILSNSKCAAYASGGFRAGENNLFSVTFDWTNHGGFTSSIAPFLQDRMH
jgi:hypothetical protein